jgi:hypothetical protein
MKAILHITTAIFPDRWYWALVPTDTQCGRIGCHTAYRGERAAKSAARRYAQQENIEIMEVRSYEP